MDNKVLDIINIVLENKGKPKISKLTPQMDLRNDIGFDSFDLAELTVRIESEFDVDIFENGLINNIGEILIKLNKI